MSMLGSMHKLFLPGDHFFRIIRLFVPRKAGFVLIKQHVMLLNLDTYCGAVYSDDLAELKGAVCSPPL